MTAPCFFTRFNTYFLPLLFLFSMALQAQAQQLQEPDQKTRKELVHKALKVALVDEKNLRDYAMLPSKKKIYVSDRMPSLNQPEKPAKEVKPELLPEFKGIKFIVLPEAEIAKRAEKKGDILFIRLRDIDNYTEQAAIIDVESVWALSAKTKKKGLQHRSAGGISLLFNKVDGAWTGGRQINYWIN